MTLSNLKHLVDHFLAIGKIEEADKILDKYPSLRPAPKEETKKEKKKNADK